MKKMAKTMLLSAVAKDPTYAEAYRSLALVAQKQGDNALCAGYLEKAIAHGGATTQNINLLKQISPTAGKSAMYMTIRNSFKQFYKDHSITKRFIAPAIPDSSESAIAASLPKPEKTKNLILQIIYGKNWRFGRNNHTI